MQRIERIGTVPLTASTQIDVWLSVAGSDQARMIDLVAMNHGRESGSVRVLPGHQAEQLKELLAAAESAIRLGSADMPGRPLLSTADGIRPILREGTAQ